MSNLVGVCPKCFRTGRLTKHHVFPKRYFGNGKKNSSVLYLCGECHHGRTGIESVLPQRKLNKEDYIVITKVWLRTY